MPLPSQAQSRPYILNAGFDFSEQAQQILTEARRTAAGLGAGAVGTEHILHSALQVSKGTATASLLQRAGTDLADVVRALEVMMPRAPGPTTAQDLGYTPEVKFVLAAAVQWVTKLGDMELDAEHLLLGALQEASGGAARVLRERGVGIEELRREMARLAREHSPARLALRIDDESALTIYQQIVQQVKEAVAAGRLGAGDRLPTVRQVAEELDIAPGTVARAYQALEQEGIVITEGARGTRVASKPDPERGNTSDPVHLTTLMRPVVVEAYHLGMGADHLRHALEAAMHDVFRQADVDGAAS